MCRGRTGSPAPLGSCAAFWEHHSPGLRGFFWKMSPACDESAVPLSAACPLLRAGRGAVPTGISRLLFALRSSCREGGEALLAAHGQELSPGAAGAEFGQLESPGDRRTHPCSSTRGQGLQLQAPTEPFPALRGILRAQQQRLCTQMTPRGRGRGWRSTGRGLEAGALLYCTE